MKNWKTSFQKEKNCIQWKRDPEKYEVEHANTQKFRKSSVIYMQNLLNQNHKKMQKTSDPL